jgi:hypothetical protein
MIEIDQTKADAMIGKTVLVGVSRCDKSGSVISHEQHFGTVLRINAHEGLVIRSAIDDQEVSLPPYLSGTAQQIPACTT